MAALPQLHVPPTQPPAGALAVTQGFGTASAQLGTNDMAAAAAAAQSKAMVEARWIMAMQRPRNMDMVRQTLLRECRRPAFAHNKSAWYRKPIGSGVEGLGIRFVEVALRAMTNVLIETNMIYADDLREIHRVSLTDLESTVTYWSDVPVSRTVERSKPMDDGSYISVRKNSAGRATYTVLATDDDLLNKRGALISKAIRTLGLRLIPGDLQDEAEDIIKAVRRDEAAKDPDAERKRIVDAFGELNVRASDLAAYLGHDIAQCSPKELVDLRGLYGAIRDGEATWAQAMENKAEQEAEKKKRTRESVNKKATEGKGEPPAAATQGKPPTFAEVERMVKDATTVEQLDEIGNLIASVQDDPDGELPTMVEIRRLELTGSAG